MPDNLHLVGSANIGAALVAPLDGRLGKYLAVLLTLEDALHATIELAGERCRVGGDGYSQVGIESEHICRQQGACAYALAVLRRHCDNQFFDSPFGKCLQKSVVAAVELLEL